jgi:ABC-2 type transport system ATP-binding protein
MSGIEASSLTKRYEGTLAVSNLDLKVPEGEIYGFLGPNGAGKTTTMRMLTALLPPTSGQAWINGTSIYDRDAITSQIGYLPESPPLYAELSAREQLDLAARLHDIPSRRATERIDSLLDRFKWSDVADEPIADYSTGMRQMVAFMQTILHEPAVVFLDEPTSGLDPRAARTLQELVTDLATGDTTVFLSTHILPVVDELADTVGVLHEGELVAEDSPAELKQRVGTGEEATLEDAFLELTTEESAAVSEANDG